MGLLQVWYAAPTGRRHYEVTGWILVTNRW
jgi:hypothetical protein